MLVFSKSTVCGYTIVWLRLIYLVRNLGTAVRMEKLLNDLILQQLEVGAQLWSDACWRCNIEGAFMVRLCMKSTV